MVDSLIREQMDALEAASDDARIKLREWELPECLQALDAGSAAALPDGLRGELERLEDHGGVRHLQDLQKQVQVSCVFRRVIASVEIDFDLYSRVDSCLHSPNSLRFSNINISRSQPGQASIQKTLELIPTSQELRRVTEEELRAVEEDLQKEAAEDAELRSQYGQRWNRPASVALNSQITEKIAGTCLVLTVFKAHPMDCFVMSDCMQSFSSFDAASTLAALA